MAVSSVDGGNIAGLGTAPDGMLLSIRVGDKVKQFAYSDDNKQELNDLLDRLDRLHSPANYGGNIEVSPPMSGLPEGKILTGTVTSAAVTTLLKNRRARRSRSARPTPAGSRSDTSTS